MPGKMKRLIPLIRYTKSDEQSITEKVFRASLTANIMNMLTWEIATLVDGACIGNFLGVEAVAAYGMIWPLTLLFGLVSTVLSGGSRSLYTKLAGKGRVEESNRAFTLACTLSVILSIATVFVIYVFCEPIAIALGAAKEHALLQPLIGSYLRAFVLGLPFSSTARILSSYMSIDSDNKRMIYAVAAMTATDIAGNLIAVFVFGGGMFALGLATAIGQVVYFLVLSTHFFRKNCMLRLDFSGILNEYEMLKEIAVSGAPAGTCCVVGAIGGIAVNNIIAAAAANEFIAAYSVHKSIGSFVSVTYFGVADTVWTLAGIYYGEEDRKSLDQLQRSAMRIGMNLVAVIALIVIVFAKYFAGLYLGWESKEALMLGTQAIRVYMLSTPLYLIYYIFEDYLMGVERYKAANVFTILQLSAFSILSVWVLVKFMGGRGAWFATPVTLILVLICIAVYISRQDGDVFKTKRLILKKNFGSALGNELNISATTKLEVAGMSRLSGLFCQENGFDRRHGYHLALCIEELGMNIIKHGFGDGKTHSIDIRILVKDDELILRVRDDCKPFNLLERYELIRQQEDDPGKNIGIRMIVNSCRDIKYLSTMSTNNLIIRI